MSGSRGSRTVALLYQRPGLGRSMASQRRRLTATAVRHSDVDSPATTRRLIHEIQQWHMTKRLWLKPGAGDRGLRGPGGLPRVAYLAVVPSALVIVAMRQWLAVSRPQFVWEEAAAHWAPTFTLDPLAYLLDTWVGYLHVLPHAVFLLARLGPPEVAPAVTDVVHWIVIAAVAGFLASDRLSRAIPDPRVRVGFALSVVLLPLAEAFDSILSAQWFLALYVAGLAVADDRRWHDYPLAALAVLSGIAVAIAAPLFLWRRDRLSVVVLGCAAIQVGLLLASPRDPQSLDANGIGMRLGVVGLVTLALTIVGMRSLTRPALVAFGYTAVATAAMGALAMGPSVALAAEGGRFFLAAGAFVALVAVAGLARARLEGAATVGLLAVALILTSRPSTLPDTRWAANAHCIGGPVPCTVPIYPAEWSVEWVSGYQPPVR